jgi:hypothetical protein
MSEGRSKKTEVKTTPISGVGSGEGVFGFPSAFCIHTSDFINVRP